MVRPRALPARSGRGAPDIAPASPSPGIGRTTTGPAPIVKVGLTCVEVWPSARKHGVDDDDMRHAVEVALAEVHLDAVRTLIIGPARDGRLLEVVVLDVDEDPVVIHAMALRPKWYRHLSGRGGR